MVWRCISTPVVDGMDVYPGDPPVRIRLACALAAGDGADVTELAMSAHAGTHVDAPGHLLPGGVGVEGLDPDVLIGPAWLAELDRGGHGAGGLHRPPAGVRRLLVRCGPRPGGGLDVAAARALAAAGVRLVGIDRPSIAAGELTMPVHRVLLEAGVVIVEGLRLAELRPGPLSLICAPLRLEGADGAPARVFVGPPGLLADTAAR